MGVWGESGRYPLVFECINITLKYLKRLEGLQNNSLASLSLQEQKCINLDWYKGIETLLNIDPSFSTDHVTAYYQKSLKSNYRAVAVSSTIGKLFSTILLDKLLEFKAKYKPDPINQLGFTKGAQTYDHIFTLTTIVSKYKKTQEASLCCLC